jgi:hypothetical protein
MKFDSRSAVFVHRKPSTGRITGIRRMAAPDRTE